MLITQRIAELFVDKMIEGECVVVTLKHDTSDPGSTFLKRLNIRLKIFGAL